MNKTSIVWLASYPKSGNTWLRFFLYSYYFGVPLDSGDINKNIPDIHSISDFDFRDTSESRIFCKTHFIYSPGHPCIDETVGFIYLLRHPKDVLLSNLNYFRLTGHSQVDPVRFAQEFIRHKGVPHWKSVGMGSWDEHANTWLSDNNMPHLVLRYENIRANPHEQFSKVLEYLGEQVDEKKLKMALQRSSFDNLSRLENKEKKKNKYSPVFWGNTATTEQGLRFINKGGVNQTLSNLEPMLDDVFDEAFREVLYNLDLMVSQEASS